MALVNRLRSHQRHEPAFEKRGVDMDTESLEKRGEDMDTESLEKRGVDLDMDTESLENRGVDLDMDTESLEKRESPCPPNSGMNVSSLYIHIVNRCTN